MLYSWTSATTADRLRSDRELFDDAQMPEGPTAYVQRLEHTAARADPSGELAKALLGHPALSRRRYARVRPWATRMGIVREYGDQLIAVVLRADAIVGRYDPSLDEPWEFRDLDDPRRPSCHRRTSSRRPTRKLAAIAWALRLRLSAAALAVPTRARTSSSATCSRSGRSTTRWWTTTRSRRRRSNGSSRIAGDLVVAGFTQRVGVHCWIARRDPSNAIVWAVSFVDEMGDSECRAIEAGPDDSFYLVGAKTSLAGVEPEVDAWVMRIAP